MMAASFGGFASDAAINVGVLRTQHTLVFGHLMNYHQLQAIICLA